MRTLPSHRHRLRVARLAALLLPAVLPAACAVPEPQPHTPFEGAWTNPERHRIVFRDDTVLQQPDNGPPTPTSAATCDGKFRFGYGRRSREALLALTPRQPDLRNRLVGVLRQPDYPVAELVCGGGDTTYVLIDDRAVVAIYRDADVAGIERLSRS